MVVIENNEMTSNQLQLDIVPQPTCIIDQDLIACTSDTGMAMQFEINIPLKTSLQTLHDL